MMLVINKFSFNDLKYFLGILNHTNVAKKQIMGNFQSNELIIVNENKFEDSENKKEMIINMEDVKFSTPNNESQNNLSGSRLYSNKSSKVTNIENLSN